MPVLPGYKINELIYESANSLIYRGIREEDVLPVVLKILKEDYPSRDELIRYRQEYEITRAFDIKGVVKAYAQVKYENSLAIILEDFGGESLRGVLARNSFSLEQLISLCIRICEILGAIHEKNVIHKDLNPSNIVYNLKTDELRIIDFGISSELPREKPGLDNLERLEGTLAYMSPEQTGRMNRTLDYRADFYALGVTLYEFFTGRLPFISSDSMELVYCHLARRPESPLTYNERIPEHLAQVIEKLMAKQADDRYQTSLGVIHDLEFCRKEIRGETNGTGFQAGASDVSQRFRLPTKIYGRKEPRDLLLDAAQASMSGRCEIMKISGGPGVGKTALVGEIHRLLVKSRGYFLSGKFEQFHRDVPCYAISSAFRDLLRQILTESESRIKGLERRLRRALGPNSRIMTDFIPELTRIIGEDDRPLELGPEAERNRFLHVFRSFIQIFQEQGRPLAIFLDDWQWADSASLSLLKLITEDSRHMFLICAYRDEEPEKILGLERTMEEIESSGTRVRSMALEPLAQEHIQEYVADALRESPENVEELAELVFQKTRGNPFFTGTFLRGLYRSGVLAFNGSLGRWDWDVAEIRQSDFSDNVVRHLKAQMEEFKEETHLFLTRASCIGTVFDLSTLVLISESSVRKTAKALWPALEAGLILPLNDQYKIAALDEMLEYEVPVKYKFAHDNIQEAAYSMIPDGEKEEVHLNVGLLLLANTPEEELEHRIFEITDHLNKGSDMSLDQDMRVNFAQLNLRAGRKARFVSSYDVALSYCLQGMGILGKNRWEEFYSLTKSLTTQAVEAAYLSQNREALEKWSADVLANVQSPVDEVQIHEIRVLDYMSRNKPPMALRVALNYLQKLGVKMPTKPSILRIILSLLYTKIKLLGKSSEKLEEIAEMSNPQRLAIMQMMQKVAAASYISSPSLFPLFSFRTIRLTLAYGSTGESSQAFAAYGIIHCGILKDFEAGYKYGLLSLKMVGRPGWENFGPRIIMLFYGLIRHWTKPLQEAIIPLRNNVQNALDIGDLEYAGYSAIFQSYFMILAGEELLSVKKEIGLYIESFQRLAQEQSAVYQRLAAQVVENLRIESQAPNLLLGEFYDEKEMLPVHLKAQDTPTLFNLYFYKIFLCCFFQKYKEAWDYSDLLTPYEEGNVGMVEICLLPYYRALILLSDAKLKGIKSKRSRLRQARSQRRKFEKISRGAQEHHSHRVYLLLAEEARFMERPSMARDYYEKAIQAARRNNFCNDEALIWELQGRYLLRVGLRDFALLSLRNAAYSYTLWGASAKVKSLKNEFPDVFVGEGHPGDTTTQPLVTTSNSESGSFSSPDMETLLKFYNAISAEIPTETLLKKLLMVLIEHTGAQDGMFVRVEENNYLVWVSPTGVSQEDAEEPLFPESILAYASRLGEPLVLEDASENELFEGDPYVKSRRPRSVICTAFTHPGRFSGILYLENNLAAGVFNRERLHIMELLFSVGDLLGSQD